MITTDDLLSIYKSDADPQARRQQMFALVEKSRQEPNPPPAEDDYWHAHRTSRNAYWHCLLDGAIALMFDKNLSADQAGRLLEYFTPGDFPPAIQIRGMEKVTPDFNLGTGDILLDSTNKLAMAEICRQVVYSWHDRPNFLAHLTALLFTNHAALETFTNALLAHPEINPFAGYRVFEFAGGEKAFTPETFPIRKLLGHYEDYTPIASPTAEVGDPSYIARKNPGKFAQVPQPRFHFVIAGDVFCEGAAGIPEQDLRTGASLAYDLLPHLATVLEDRGLLLISNIKKDGYLMHTYPPIRDPGGMIVQYGNPQALPEVTEAGFALPQRGISSSPHGVSTLVRDYSRRPGIPFEPKEKPASPAKSPFLQTLLTRDTAGAPNAPQIKPGY